jgi:hypothetical protein
VQWALAGVFFWGGGGSEHDDASAKQHGPLCSIQVTSSYRPLLFRGNTSWFRWAADDCPHTSQTEWRQASQTKHTHPHGVPIDEAVVHIQIHTDACASHARHGARTVCQHYWGKKGWFHLYRAFTVVLPGTTLAPETTMATMIRPQHKDFTMACHNQHHATAWNIAPAPPLSKLRKSPRSTRSLRQL